MSNPEAVPRSGARPERMLNFRERSSPRCGRRAPPFDSQAVSDPVEEWHEVCEAIRRQHLEHDGDQRLAAEQEVVSVGAGLIRGGVLEGVYV